MYIALERFDADEFGDTRFAGVTCGEDNVTWVEDSFRVIGAFDVDGPSVGFRVECWFALNGCRCPYIQLHGFDICLEPIRQFIYRQRYTWEKDPWGRRSANAGEMACMKDGRTILDRARQVYC